MSLSLYLMNARDLCKELQQECEKIGIEFASAIIVQLGKENWKRLLLDGREDFFAYLRATPSQRKRKSGWKDTRFQTVFAVGALLYAQRSVAYLEIAVALEHLEGHRYRDALALAAELVAEHEDLPDALWPFDSNNPF